MAYLKHPDFRLHYQSNINGDESIIFVHGNFGSWRYWQSYFQQLPEKFSGYAPELRGCGKSEAPEGHYDIQTLSKDILYFADALNLQKFHLVGHSLGGAVAQELAGHHADRVLSLTLVAPVPAEGLVSLKKIPTNDTIFSAKNIWQFFDSIGLRKTIHRTSFKKTMPGLRKNKTYLNMIIEDALKMDNKAFNGFLATLKNWTGTQYLHLFTFPVLIIYGDLDSVIPFKPLSTMSKSINNCHLQVFNGVGHSPMLELPNAFNVLLTTFLERGNNTDFSQINTSASRKSSWATRLRKTLKKITAKFN